MPRSRLLLFGRHVAVMLAKSDMPNDIKTQFLADLLSRFPSAKKLPDSQSLYDLGGGNGRVYIRYSKVHPGRRTFYGLRKTDLLQLEGHNSTICFLWDGQSEPLLVPFADFEDVFQTVAPADDGQFKAQVYLQPEGAELYLVKAGRFNVESYFGWNELSSRASQEASAAALQLSHSQVQTLLGAIGTRKGNDIWVPASDRAKLDWGLASPFAIRGELPAISTPIADVLCEVDVIWMKRGSGDIAALFEVEHSTPVYSGLLRFNDFHLTLPTIRPRFSVVSNDARRSLFVRQVNRPTFRTSGLAELCTFLEYANVFDWWRRLAGDGAADTD
ncbi:MAG TPA: hypothetical protein VGY55_06970 [Pirellulales bacterium]|jgi:hypothetical protein|nr:hypothetical protein [Pirellulales bacterium]